MFCVSGQNNGRPPYLADLLQFHKTPKSSRSSSSQLLFVPRHNLSFGSRAFRVSAPKVWNTLPLHVRQSQSLSAFRRHLLPLSLSCHLASIHLYAPWFCSFRLYGALQIIYLLTYLLTYIVSSWERSWLRASSIRGPPHNSAFYDILTLYVNAHAHLYSCSVTHSYRRLRSYAL